MVTHVLPLSPGQSQILNWNVLLPHKLLWPLKCRESWESGKREKRRSFISNQWDYWETEGGWWLMSPVITKQKGLFLVQLFYALKVVMGFKKYICHRCIIIIYHVYTNKERTLQRWNCRLYWRYNTFIFKAHHLIITEQKPRELPNTAQLSYIHKNITVKLHGVQCQT